jgi:hypothetical protein
MVPPSFGTRGSQVQILPLRPALSRFFVLFGPRIGPRNRPETDRWQKAAGEPLAVLLLSLRQHPNNVSTAYPLVSATA